MIANLIETQRLMIKNTTPEYTQFSIGIWLDEVMGAYLSDPPREKAGDLYDEWEKTIETYDGCYYFTAFLTETGDPIGTCSVAPNDDRTSWDIGYAIHKNYWRMGYATELIRGLIDFCRTHGGGVITATVAKENYGSNAVLRKLGFSIAKEGHFKKQGTELTYESYDYCLVLERSIRDNTVSV